MSKILVVGDVDISWFYVQETLTAPGTARALSQKHWSGCAMLGGAPTLIRQLKDLGLKKELIHGFAKNLGSIEKQEASRSLPIVSAEVANFEDPDKEQTLIRIQKQLGWAAVKPGAHQQYSKFLKNQIANFKKASSQDYISAILVADSWWGFSLSYFQNQGTTFKTYRDFLKGKLGLEDGSKSEQFIVIKSRVMPPKEKAETFLDSKSIQYYQDVVSANSPEYLDECMVVVVPVADLRSLGLEVSQGISWERTLQALGEAAEDGFKDVAGIPGLLESKYVVVVLGTDGIVVIERTNPKEVSRMGLIFHPPSIEGDARKRTAGDSFANNSWVASFIAAHLRTKQLVNFTSLCKVLRFALAQARYSHEKGMKWKSGELYRGETTSFGRKKEVLGWSLYWNEGTPAANSFSLAALQTALNGDGKCNDRAYSRFLKDNIRYLALDWQKLKVKERQHTSSERRSKDQANDSLVNHNNPNSFSDTWWTILSQVLAEKTSANDDEVLKLYYKFASHCLVYGGPSSDEFFPDLLNCPYARFNDFVTIDRAEIESFRNLGSIISEYYEQNQPNPLNIAVFGPPGSGKSFGIKELVKSLKLNREVTFKTFNLSQFDTIEALQSCFQTIQNEVLRNKFPVVFWDEFDTTLQNVPFGWLHAFLAPMQDGEFVANNQTNAIGKCIFVFAGSRFNSFWDLPDPNMAVERPREQVITMSALEALEHSREKTTRRTSQYELERMEYANLLRRQENWRLAKGNDFRSRLKGYLDVREPNLERKIHQGEFLPFSASDPDTCDQPAFIVRRARSLRARLLRDYKELFVKEKAAFDPNTLGVTNGNRAHERTYKKLKVNDAIVRGLLSPQKFRHGQRSLESVLFTSELVGKASFERSSLPAATILGIHIEPSAFEDGYSTAKSTESQFADEYKSLACPPSSFKEEKPELSVKQVPDIWKLQDINFDKEKDLSPLIVWGRASSNVESVEIMYGPSYAKQSWEFSYRLLDAASPHLFVPSQEELSEIGAKGNEIEISIAIRFYDAGEVSVMSDSTKLTYVRTTISGQSFWVWNGKIPD